MKKIYFLLLAFSFFTTANAQIVDIPDANFKAMLLASNTTNTIAKNLLGAYFKIDANNDKEIQISEALNVEYLDSYRNEISSLVGVEKFTKLKGLKCDYNLLTNLDVTGLTNLVELNCSSNQLTSLNVSSLKNLQTLNCLYNKLTSLNVTGLTNLQTLDCQGNHLTSLDVKNLTNLQSLNFYNNRMTSFNVTGLTNLQKMNCGDNFLTSLDVSDLTNLKELTCHSNQLISLTVSGLTNLQNLYCSSNQLTSIDLVSLTNLQNLYCNSNQLASIDLSGLTNLTSFYCNSNQLTSLDLKGLINLEGLYCYSNQLNSLNVKGLTNLHDLYCGSNQLISLDLTDLNSLTNMDCSNNQLTILDVKGLTNLILLNFRENKLSIIDFNELNSLANIDCSYNQLTSLNLTGLINLQVLYCESNQLTSLDLGNLTNIESLICSFNQLTSLNLVGLNNLNYLNCSGNQMTTLDVASLSNLTDLYCASNKLTDLNFSPESNKLNILYCEKNQLTDLSGISNSLNLETLDCSDNKLTHLDVGNLYNLRSLFCNNNNLETLFFRNLYPDLSFLELLGNLNLKYICITGNEFSFEDRVAQINVFLNLSEIKNCEINSYCSFVPGGTFYTIQGNQKLDNDLNGCDSKDIFLQNLKYTITNGTETGSVISDFSGNYSIPVQAGTHIITPKLENPTYFTVSPATFEITFPSEENGSSFTQDFCITPNNVHPDLEVTLLPLDPARPGFDAKYKLIYKNKGNTIQSGSINLSFNDAVLDLVVTNPLATNQTTNNLSWNFTTLQPFETREISFTMNVNSPMEIPAVIIGDILNFGTTITSSATDETPTDNTFTFNQTVVGSYDPNDKTCLEGSVITPNLIGQYVHYTIRFENTGTFAAENVVVKDMIDLTKFDISTLVPTSASHSFVTNITAGNKVEFIFENINLPFDDANNDGYIAFKIKTKPTLVVNDSFSNEANIYFDYNFPILTNKATSTFKTLGTPDFDFARYFTVYPNPAKADLNITAKETINVKSMSVYNTLGQLVLVVTNADKVSKIDVSSLTSGNYFIKITTDKGITSSRFVKE